MSRKQAARRWLQVEAAGLEAKLLITIVLSCNRCKFHFMTESVINDNATHYCAILIDIIATYSFHDDDKFSQLNWAKNCWVMWKFVVSFFTQKVSMFSGNKAKSFPTTAQSEIPSWCSGADEVPAKVSSVDWNLKWISRNSWWRFYCGLEIGKRWGNKFSS